MLLASLRVEKTITGCPGTLSPLDYKDYGFEQNADITEVSWYIIYHAYWL